MRISVTVERELIQLARKFKINISRALEEKLVEILREYGIEYTTREHILENLSKRRRKKVKKVVEIIKKMSEKEIS